MLAGEVDVAGWAKRELDTATTAKEGPVADIKPAELEGETGGGVGERQCERKERGLVGALGDEVKVALGREVQIKRRGEPGANQTGGGSERLGELRRPGLLGSTVADDGGLAGRLHQHVQGGEFPLGVEPGDGEEDVGSAQSLFATASADRREMGDRAAFHEGVLGRVLGPLGEREFQSCCEGEDEKKNARG